MQNLKFKEIQQLSYVVCVCCICHKDLQHEVTLSPLDSFVGLQKELEELFSERQLVIQLLKE